MSYTNPEQERQNQIREAARMGEPDEGRSTLHISRPRPVTRHNTERRPQQNRGPRPKHTPKGHDAKLKAWQAEGREVVVGLVFGVSETVDTHTGVIIESDRYTITLRFGTGAEALIYKHAIACIYPQPECCASEGTMQ